jgi:RHS repeat-associated protein
MGPLKDVLTAAGAWDIWYGDIAITSTNGTVTTLLGSSGQASPWGAECQGSYTSVGVEMQIAGTAPGIVGSGADTHFYLGDHLGTAQMEFAAGGWPVWQGQFAPFGGELHNGVAVAADQPDPTTANHYKFTGKERDTESGLDFFGARYYASNTGRFMSPDWSPQAEAVPYASLGNPQTLNLYGYAGNNPLSQVDVDGHDFDGGWNTKPGSDEFASGESLQDAAHNSATAAAEKQQQQQQAQQHDITSQQGQTILKEAQSYDGTPYSQNTVPPNNTRGQKGPSSSVDCSHLVCFAANIPYANADGLQRSSHLRPLQAGEQRQAGDVIIFTDAKGHGFHAAFWDPNPPVAGHNVYGATTSRNNPDHNMQWLPLTNSRGQSTFGGTPTFYRLVQ